MLCFPINLSSTDQKSEMWGGEGIFNLLFYICTFDKAVFLLMKRKDHNHPPPSPYAMYVYMHSFSKVYWFLLTATSPCPFPGFYGLLNCIKCGRCAGNGDCHLLTGVCNGGCQLGFFGSKCNMTCSATCGGDGSCSQLTAFCENGCQSGFTGTQCDQIITSPESGK